MGIELIHNENPGVIGCGFNGAGNVVSKIILGASGPHRWTDHPSLRNVPVGNQAEGAMSDILKLLPFGLSKGHWVSGQSPFKRLNPGHLVRAHDMHSLSLQGLSAQVQVTNRFDLSLKLDRVIRVGVEPVATAMRLKTGFFLKNDPHSGAKQS